MAGFIFRNLTLKKSPTMFIMGLFLLNPMQYENEI